MIRKLLSGALAMLLIGLAVGCTGSEQGSDEPKYKPLNYVLYEKEGNMYYSALDDSENILVAKDDGDAFGSSFEYGVLTTLSDNQKRLFYIQENEGSMYGGTLYYRDVLEDGSLSDANKIATEILLYKISEDGGAVMYSKTYDQGVYYYDVETDEKEKLDDLTSYYVEISKDGKRGIYNTYNYETDELKGYEFEVGSEPQEIEAGYYEIVDAKEDLSSYYFVDEENFYYKEFGKEAELLAKNVVSVEKIYDSGEFYYYSYNPEDTGVDVRELIIDDMYDEDRNIEEIGYPTYPEQANYATEEAWEEALTAYQEQFHLAQQSEAKKVRDEIRKGLEGKEVFAINLSLHYYDGEKTNLIAEYMYEDISQSHGYGNALFFDDEPGVFFFSSFDRQEKVKLSELDFYYNTSEAVLEALNKTASLYYAKGAEVTRLISPSELGAMDRDLIVLSKNQKTLYLLHRASEDYEFDLYGFELGGEVQEPEKLQKNILGYPFASFADGSLLTAKATEPESWNVYEIYLDGEKFASRASVEWKDADNMEYVLIEDKADDISENGTLVHYKNHEPTEIDTKVKMAFVNAAGDLFYLKKFDDEEWVGDLYYFKNGEGELVAKRTRYVDISLGFEDVAG